MQDAVRPSVILVRPWRERGRNFVMCRIASYKLPLILLLQQERAWLKVILLNQSPAGSEKEQPMRTEISSRRE